jgi:uncharacterized membrane protein YhdT
MEVHGTTGGTNFPKFIQLACFKTKIITGTILHGVQKRLGELQKCG